MRILTFDISRHCGWAHDRDGGGVPFSGTAHFAKIGGSKISGFEFGACGADALAFFFAKIDLVKPDLIGAEAPLQHRSSIAEKNEMSARNSLGLVYMCEAIAHRLEIPYEEVDTRDMKMFFAGTCRGEKEPVKARCRQLGWKYDDDNAADAMGLWAYLKAIHEPQFAYQSTPLFGRASA